MKKLLLILLCLFTFSNVFASSQYSRSDRVYGGIIGAFNFLITTRNKGSSDSNIASRRQQAENLLAGSMRQGYKNQVVAAYEEEKNELEESYNKHKISKDGNEHLSAECLNELTRISMAIGIK